MIGQASVTICVISLASVISMAWVPGGGVRGETNNYNCDILGAPEKNLPRGASDVVTPLATVVFRPSPSVVIVVSELWINDAS